MKKVFILAFAFAALSFSNWLQAAESLSAIQKENNPVGVAPDTVAIPWRESFESAILKDVMPYGMSNTCHETSINVNVYLASPETSSTNYHRVPRSGQKFVTFSNLNCDDWVFTTGIFLRAGVKYRFSFWHITAGASGWEALEAKVGLAPSAEGMTMRIGDSLVNPVNVEYQKYEGGFIPSKDDIYYFGIHAKRTNNSYLSIDDLELDYGQVACTELNAFSRNITVNEADIYRAYTPLQAQKFLIDYRMSNVTDWTTIDIPVSQLAYRLTDLTQSTKYHFRLGAVCQNDTLWSKIDSLTTLRTPATQPAKLPIDENFDGTSGITWKFANGTQLNKWFIGGTQDSLLKQVAFISNTTGSTNTYDSVTISTTHLHTDNFLIPEDAEELLFSFDWKANGEIYVPTLLPYDFLRIYLLNSSLTPTAGTLLSGVTNGTHLFGKDFLLKSTWNSERLVLGNELSGQIKKLVFIWRNNGSKGSNPPAAIDNIVFKPIFCGTPKEVKVEEVVSDKQLRLSCANAKEGVGFNIAYREKGNTDTTWLLQKGGNTNKDAIDLNNLTSKTFYEIKLQKRCDEDTSFWSETVEAQTGMIATAFPVDENFDDGSAKCEFANGTQKNNWVVGSSAYSGATGKGIYISDNNTDNHYDNTAKSIVHFYYDIEFPQAENFRLSFDWNGVGKSSDVLRVSMVDLDVIPAEGEMLPNEGRLFEKDFYNRRTWAHEELVFSNELSGKRQRLVFTWKNAEGKAGQPPVVIDNLKFEAFDCKMPTLRLVGSSLSTIAVMCEKLDENNTFVVNYRPKGDEDWLAKTIYPADMFGLDKFNLTNLDSNTIYEIKVKQQCGINSSVFTPMATIRTIQTPAKLPLTENFEQENLYKNWVLLNEGQTNHWTIGTAEANGDEKSIYITNKVGTYTCDSLTSSTVHFFRDISFADAKEYELRFDWKGGSQNTPLSVYIANTNQIIEAGSINSKGAILDGQKFYGSENWKSESIIIPSEQLINSTRSLVFTWQNNSASAEQAPVAIDNIKLIPIKCAYPKDVRVAAYKSSDTVQFQFLVEESNNNFIINYTNVQTEAKKSAKADNIQPMLSGLLPNTVYNIEIRNICASGDSSLWSNPIQIRMPQNFITLPFVERFEEEESFSKWTIVNGEAADKNNKWFVDKAVHTSEVGNQAIYIDSLDGNTNACRNHLSRVHLYRDIKFPDTKNEINLSFQWRFQAKSGNHSYFKVYVVDLEEVPVLGFLPETSIYQSANLFSLDSNWHDTIISFAADKLAGKRKRLIFTWYNSASSDFLPIHSLAIDNVNFTYPECNTPFGLSAKTLSYDSVQLKWRCEKDAGNKFAVYYTNNGNQNRDETTDTVITLSNLNSNTVYNITLKNECRGDNNTAVNLSIRTPQKNIVFTYEENFDNAASIHEWTLVNSEKSNKWYLQQLNSGEANAPKYAAYISDNGGLTNSYAGKAGDTTFVHLYRDIQFNYKEEFSLSFNWRAMGRLDVDCMNVYLVDTSVVPVPNKLIPTQTDVLKANNPYSNSIKWRNEFITLRGVKNAKKRLVFTWRNTYLTPSQPPVAFGNLVMTALDCPTPTNLKVIAFPSTKSVVLKWDSVSTKYNLRYRRYGEYSWTNIPVSGRNIDTLRELETNNKAYDVQVLNPCDAGSYEWSPIVIFHTPQTPMETGTYEDFETAEGRDSWSMINGDCLNAWAIDTAIRSGVNRNYAAYVTADKGYSYVYNGNDPRTSVSHLYRDLEIKENQKELQLSFDWQCMGMEKDFMRVYLINDSTTPKTGTLLPDSLLLTGKQYQYYKHDWKNESITLPTTDINLNRNRLVFTWINDAAGEEQTPAAIDNVFFGMYKCASPKNIATAAGIDSIGLRWNSQEDGGSSLVKYASLRGGNEEVVFVNDLSCTLKNLNAGTKYRIQIRTTCASGDTSAWISYFAETKQIPDTVPFAETFEEKTRRNMWTTHNGDGINAWFIDTVSNGNGVGSRYSGYISELNGSVYTYAGYSPTLQYTYVYRDVVFPPAPEYLLTFDWKGVGEQNLDYLQAFLVDTKDTLSITKGLESFNNPKAKTARLWNSRNWTTGNALLSGYSADSLKRLVFMWAYNISNNPGYASQPPASIDNISITPLSCETPKSLTLLSLPDSRSAQLSWVANGDTFTVAYRKDPGSTWQYVGFKTKTVVLTGLTPSSVYEVKVKNSCGDPVVWSSSILVKTSQEPIEPTFIEDFESGNANAWVVANGTQANKWYVGDAADKSDGNSIYISNDNGISNKYWDTVSYVYFYKDFIFPNDGTLELSFDWKCTGQTASIDYLRAGITNITTTPVAGSIMTIGTYNNLGTLIGAFGWTTATYKLSDTLAGKQKRLFFQWYNNANGNHPPPAAVDNIKMTHYKCGEIKNLKIQAVTAEELALSWKGTNATNFLVEYKPLSSTQWLSENVDKDSCFLSALEPQTHYNIRITPTCEGGLGKFIQDTAFVPHAIPFFEDFSSGFPENWYGKRAWLNMSGGKMKLQDSTTYASFDNNNIAPFANVSNASNALKFITSNSTEKLWAITPPVYLNSEKRYQIEFKLALSRYNYPERAPEQSGYDDKFGVFISTTDSTTWSLQDNLAMWDNEGFNQIYNTINHTVTGDKVKILLDNYSGVVNFAFYLGSNVVNAYNNLFIDSISIRPYECEAVSDVKISDIGFDVATVSFNPADKEQYLWQLSYGVHENEQTTIPVLEKNKWKLDHLDTNQIYKLSIRALCEDTIESKAKMLTFTTLSLCEKMSEDSIAAIPSDVTATITWAANAGVNKSWELRYGSATATLDQMQIVYVSSPSYTINGLTEETQYAYYLRAVCVSNNDTSNWTERKTFTTLRTPCPVVSNVTVTNIRTNSATVSWDAPAGQTQWEVRYGSQGSTISVMTSNLTTAKTIALPNLTENSAYDVVVRAICRANDSSDWSARKQFSTIACGTVTGLTVAENANAISATLSWTVPNPDQIEWQVGIDTNDNLSTASVKSTTSNPYTINYAEWNINKAKDYYIAIKAKCGNTLSNSWSDYAILNKEGIDALDNTQVISINLTPNPAKDFAKLSIGGAEGQVDVQIYTVTGTLVMSEKLNCTPQSTKEFTIKGLQRGAYTIRIVHEKWTRTEKLIVQ